MPTQTMYTGAFKVCAIYLIINRVYIVRQSWAPLARVFRQRRKRLEL